MDTDALDIREISERFRDAIRRAIDEVAEEMLSRFDPVALLCPHCEETFFQWDNRRRIYCSSRCRNASNQRKYLAKKRGEE